MNKKWSPGNISFPLFPEEYAVAQYMSPCKDAVAEMDD